ncbi:RNA/RNP complex-1-interacting phosphatase homolog [Styela clava]
MAPKNGPPDRWMDYSPMGERIPGTRFICMKVPLKPHLSRNISENEKFGCDTALEMAKSKGHNLGLVIDLSFTTKYYDPKEFEEKNVQYKKIFVPGRVIPQSEVLDSFSDVVVKFEDENQDNDKLIAVHCTHGLNRTGYMICRHLVNRKNFKPEDAIEAFEKARGYKIERQVYLDDLLGTSSDVAQKNETSRSSENKHSQQGNSYGDNLHPRDRFYHDDYQTDSGFYDNSSTGLRQQWYDPLHLANSYDYEYQQRPYGRQHFNSQSTGQEGFHGYNYYHNPHDRYGQPIYQPNPYRWQNPNYERQGHHSKPYSPPNRGAKYTYKSRSDRWYY